MSEISSFLLARIAEDEGVARRALEERDRRDRAGEAVSANEVPVDVADNGSRPGVWTEAERVLAECAAKRDLVEWSLGLEYLRDVGDPQAPAAPLGDEVLQVLATVYSNHEHFDERWRR